MNANMYMTSELTPYEYNSPSNQNQVLLNERAFQATDEVLCMAGTCLFSEWKGDDDSHQSIYKNGPCNIVTRPIDIYALELAR